MGLLVDGKWVDDSHDTSISSDGSFKRPETQFRNWITKDGSSGFPAEHGRYHLYVSYACPWAHRTLLMRKLKGLEASISFSVVDPFMNDDDGWKFSDYPGATQDPICGAQFLYQIYQRAKPDMTGWVTVPVLFDKVTQTIVSNESPEIILMLNNAYEGPDFYPEELRGKIEEVNEWAYDRINNGVYKCGFATTQGAYEEAVTELFLALDRVEEILDKNRFLTGDRFTTADLRLFTTLVRFDAVYVGHFKCNLKRIVDYPNIWNYLKEIYQMPGVAETVNMRHIKEHYYRSHTFINPTQVVPKGPIINFEEPHNRAEKFRTESENREDEEDLGGLF
jgi:glutathionyl-hydroquinone reductase